MRDIHTFIVSRHLATIGYNKILRTPPPHISSSEEILPRLARRNLTQLRTNKSPFLKLQKVDAKSHPSPLCPICNTHTHDIHHLFYFTHIRTMLQPHGGVRILYKKSLAKKYVSHIKSANKRVCAVKITTDNDFTCLIVFVYLPCDTYTGTVQQSYSETIDYIESLINEHECKSVILLWRLQYII